MSAAAPPTSRPPTASADLVALDLLEDEAYDLLGGETEGGGAEHDFPSRIETPAMIFPLELTPQQ